MSKNNFSKIASSFIEIFVSKYLFLILLFIILTSSYFYLDLLNHDHDWGDDFASYVMQARALATDSINSFYASNQFTISKSSFTLGPIFYPWGFPIYLSYFYKLFGLNLFAFKLSIFPFYIGFLITIFYGFKKYLSKIDLIIILTILAFNQHLITYGNQILSDIPYLFFSIFSLFLIIKFENNYKKNTFINNLALAISIGFLVFISYLFRSMGVALILLIAIIFFEKLFHFLSENIQKKNNFYSNFLQERSIYFLLSLMIIFLLLILFNLLKNFSLNNNYLIYFEELNFSIFRSNLIYYFKLPIVFFYTNFYSPPSVAIIFFNFLFFAGLIGSYKKNYLFVVYIFLNISILLFWPYQQGIRFIFPIIPFYIFFVIKGMDVIFNKKYLFIKYFLLIIIGFSFFMNTLFLKNTDNSIENYQLMNINSLELYDFLNSETNLSDKIIFRKPRAIKLFVDRKVAAINNENFIHDFQYLVYQKNLDSYGQINLQNINALVRNKKLLKSFENNGFIVYLITK